MHLPLTAAQEILGRRRVSERHHVVAAGRVDNGLDLRREALQGVSFFLGVIIAIVGAVHAG